MGRKPQYNHVRVTLTPVPPPLKTWTTPTYHLERYTIRRNVKTVNVQLHGLRGNEKRTESISFPLLPNVTDTELVRAAVFCSTAATQQPSPTSQPTQQPTATPTPTPTARPTQAVKPTPTPCPGINCNPWGYNFSSGRLIYTPPSNFCDYFNCIPSFWGADDPGDGYVVECSDSLYSQSGGERGACSYHGGVLRPLYAH